MKQATKALKGYIAENELPRGEQVNLTKCINAMEDIVGTADVKEVLENWKSVKSELMRVRFIGVPSVEYTECVLHQLLAEEVTGVKSVIDRPIYEEEVLTTHSITLGCACKVEVFTGPDGIGKVKISDTDGSLLKEIT